MTFVHVLICHRESEKKEKNAFKKSECTVKLFTAAALQLEKKINK